MGCYAQLKPEKISKIKGVNLVIGSNEKFKPVKFVAEENKTIYFCHCKQTNNQPFCDGSHNK